MERQLKVAMAAFGLFASVANAAPAGTLCDGLAVRARAIAPAAWAKAWNANASAFGADLTFEDLRRPGDDIERAIAASPLVRAKTSALVPGEEVEVEHLAGTGLYLAATLQGTLNCEDFTLLRSRSPRAFTPVDAPPGYNDDEGLCWTRSADLGRALGAPILVTHGANSQTTDAEDMLITRWTGAGWDKPCRLDLRFRVTFTRSGRNCLDPDVCRSLDGEVLRIAVAQYQRQQQGPNPPPYDFAATGEIPAEIRAAVQAQQGDTNVPDFPATGPNRIGFSYNDLDYVALRLNGRVLLAAIGHAGVGWRESNTTLIAIYDVVDGKLAPKAGWAFDRSIAALASARAH